MPDRVVAAQLGEDPDLAHGAVVDHRSVEPRDHGLGIAQPGPVDREDRPRVKRRELLAMRHEALVALGVQTLGQHVDVDSVRLG